ncbi:PepSY domain-containing protein [Alsobacter sp. SYSU M60028]|uniref:PepSY domain-containing protein n=1 Tax=Alsobacter ponti TaxID=2962936 RepID=A0ABT1L8K7_9HYPH|nr:PepSY domain-containing protein [Alsobacter ponti]MCP8937734.1 PepSY domain-containing protein [Alsobacter ponti]
MTFARTLVPAFLALIAAQGAEAASAGKTHGCLNEAEIREEVAAKRVIAQVAALRAARSQVGGEAVRARLCRSDAGLVYSITALKRDGKVVRVLVDATSGRIVAEK